MNRKRVWALRGRVSQGGCDASHANRAKRGKTTKEQEKKCAMRRRTRWGKMRWDRTEDRPGEKWGTKKEGVGHAWRERQGRMRERERERERETVAFYLAPKGREESAHASAGPVGELCRVSRLKVGQRTNQLSKAKPGVYPENNRTYRPALAWASHRRNMHS